MPVPSVQWTVNRKRDDYKKIKSHSESRDVERLRDTKHAVTLGQTTLKVTDACIDTTFGLRELYSACVPPVKHAGRPIVMKFVKERIFIYFNSRVREKHWCPKKYLPRDYCVVFRVIFGAWFLFRTDIMFYV